jgi:beta-glucanase (GH16 family)
MSQEDPHGPITWEPGVWTIVWQDEFDGPAGSPPDPTKWKHQIGEDMWGNKELEYYTDSTDNSSLDGEGHLLITARQEAAGNKMYTSARLTTNGTYKRLYGKFEARMRLARGRGLWPAFWMMGDDFDQVGWPTCGEIDVMEQRGSVLTHVWSGLHGPGYGDRFVVLTAGLGLVPGGVDVDFHTYGVEWDPNNVVFLIDDVPFLQLNSRRRPPGARWVYEHPYFMILNMAVGGEFPGSPDETTVFPYSIAVDWVRVSARQTPDGDAGVEAGAAVE